MSMSDDDMIEVVRCKDCKYYSSTTIGMQYACWHGAYKVYGETGEHEKHHVCTAVESDMHYCSYGEKEQQNE